VLDFYDDVDSRRGNDRNANVSRGQLDPLLRQLGGVDDDDEDLLAFLGALSDGSFDRTTPDVCRVGLRLAEGFARIRLLTRRAVSGWRLHHALSRHADRSHSC
jgi:hypothetical protein